MKSWAIDHLRQHYTDTAFRTETVSVHLEGDSFVIRATTVRGNAVTMSVPTKDVDLAWVL